VVWSENQIQEIFTKLGARSYYLIGVIVLAFIGIELADVLTNFCVEHFRWIRSVIAGADDIEGDWVNIVVNSTSPHTLLYAEYCRLRFHHGAYQLSGDTWALDGKWVGSFTTSGSNFNGREFEYYYKTGIMRVGGFGYILYSPIDSTPSDFICRYIDETIKTPHVARGTRLTRTFPSRSLDDRKSRAMEYANNFDSKGLLDLEAMFGPKPNP